MSKDLAKVISKMFISRADVKAIQRTNGDYNPVREPWKMDDILAHLDGSKTYGHYVVSKDDTAKLFCFDVDLEKAGFLPDEIVFHASEAESYNNFQPALGLREEWLNRKSTYRTFMKRNFHYAAHKLAKGIMDTLDIPVAVAYTGSKGVHIYGFTGPMLAGDIRIGAQLVLDDLGCFEPSRGEHMFKHRDKQNEYWQNLNIEIYPKQDSLESKDLGNLLRLPLGRNLKSTDPTFFVDMTGPMNSLNPTDAITALTSGNPFKRAGE